MGNKFIICCRFLSCAIYSYCYNWLFVAPISFFVFSGGCPRSWYIFRDFIYFVSSDLVSHDTAVSICENLGAQLTTIHSFEEQRFIGSEYSYYVYECNPRGSEYARECNPRGSEFARECNPRGSEYAHLSNECNTLGSEYAHYCNP